MDREIDMVALLCEPVRRALHEQVRRADHPVSREEAASRAGVSRSLPAFHLDKLAEAGLLEVASSGRSSASSRRTISEPGPCDREGYCCVMSQRA